MINEKNARCASICAVLVLIGTGTAFRSLEDDSEGPIIHGPACEIENFPIELGSWRGRTLLLDERIIEATATDAYMSRCYRSAESGAEIGLYVGCGVRVRDLVPHRPTVCYPGAGWTLSGERAYTLESTGANQLDCRIYRFERGGLDSRSITVLNYYIIDGTSYPDVTYLRSRGWGHGNIGYVAQVQLTSGDRSAAEAEARVIEFAAAAASAIRRVVLETAAAAARGVPVQ